MNAGESSDGCDAQRNRADAGLEQRLAEAEGKAKEHLDGWQRERASFANYRRRIETERESLSQAAYAEVICQFLPVLDDLERAVGKVPESEKSQPWVQGVSLVARKFEQTLRDLGVEPIVTQGSKFDPTVHEALTHEAAEGYAEGDIVGELARGFKLGGRILRCSRVRVAKSQPGDVS
jgi:molecular chaperone GrpE